MGWEAVIEGLSFFEVILLITEFLAGLLSGFLALIYLFLLLCIALLGVLFFCILCMGNLGYFVAYLFDEILNPILGVAKEKFKIRKRKKPLPEINLKHNVHSKKDISFGKARH